MGYLWGIANTLLSDIVEENENEVKECIDEDVHAAEVLPPPPPLGFRC